MFKFNDKDTRMTSFWRSLIKTYFIFTHTHKSSLAQHLTKRHRNLHVKDDKNALHPQLIYSEAKNLRFAY